MEVYPADSIKEYSAYQHPAEPVYSHCKHIQAQKQRVRKIIMGLPSLGASVAMKIVFSFCLSSTSFSCFAVCSRDGTSSGLAYKKSARRRWAATKGPPFASPCFLCNVIEQCFVQLGSSSCEDNTRQYKDSGVFSSIYWFIKAQPNSNGMNTPSKTAVFFQFFCVSDICI